VVRIVWFWCATPTIASPSTSCPPTPLSESHPLRGLVLILEGRGGALGLARCHGRQRDQHRSSNAKAAKLVAWSSLLKLSHIADRTAGLFFAQTPLTAKCQVTGRECGGASSPSDETELSCKERLCIAFGSSALHPPESCQAQKGLPIEPVLGALAPEVRNQ
jgi:hypothetical protein